MITDEEISEFNKIKKIALNKNLNLYSLFDKKNNFQFISHEFEGEAQILKFKYNNLTSNQN